MEPPAEGASTSDANQNAITTEDKSPGLGAEMSNRSWKDKFQKGAQKLKNDAQKSLKVMKKGVKMKISGKDIKEGIKAGAQKIGKGSKKGFEKLQQEFWIGAEVFKEGVQIGMEKLKRGSIITSRMARNSMNWLKEMNLKENMKKIGAKARASHEAVKKRLQAMHMREKMKRMREKAKKMKENVKDRGKKVKRRVRKLRAKGKVQVARALQQLHIITGVAKLKRVSFWTWFMYNCHTTKLMCLACWIIENPKIVMDGIKRRESSCATLIPVGYGALIHKSLILTPYQYVNNNKKALKGEILISFGNQKPHSPAASCIASETEVERGLAPPASKKHQIL